LDYISPPELKILLKKYPTLKAILGNLQIELQTVILRGKKGLLGSKSEILYALSLGNRVLSDMPRAEPSPGGKTTNIIANYKKIVDEEYANLIHELLFEINEIGGIVEKIMVGLQHLTEEQLTCINDFYFLGRTWQQVADTLRTSRENVVIKIHPQSIDQLLEAIRITKEECNYCMEQLSIKETQQRKEDVK
jgi:hypothetical protein